MLKKQKDHEYITIRIEILTQTVRLHPETTIHPEIGKVQPLLTEAESSQEVHHQMSQTETEEI